MRTSQGQTDDGVVWWEFYCSCQCGSKISSAQHQDKMQMTVHGCKAIAGYEVFSGPCSTMHYTYFMTQI